MSVSFKEVTTQKSHGNPWQADTGHTLVGCLGSLVTGHHGMGGGLGRFKMSWWHQTVFGFICRFGNCYSDSKCTYLLFIFIY